MMPNRYQLRFMIYLLLIGHFFGFEVRRAQAGASAESVATIKVGQQVVKITKERLLAYASSHPKKELRACLRDLVDFELLALEARRRGMDSTPGVTHGTHQALVRLFLNASFSAQWSAEAMPREYVEQAYQKNYSRFNKPESRDGDHVITTLDSKRPSDPELDRKAKEMADAIYADMRAHPPRDRAEFLDRGRSWMARAEDEGFEVRAQPLGRFGRNGRYAKSFTDEVFKYEGDGIIIPPFVTEFGHHVVRIDKTFPAVARGLDEVEGEIRERITEQVRGQKLRELTDDLAATYPPINDGVGVNALINFAPLFALERRTSPTSSKVDSTPGAQSGTAQ